MVIKNSDTLGCVQGPLTIRNTQHLPQCKIVQQHDACSTMCPSYDFIFSSGDRLFFFGGLSRSENGEKKPDVSNFLRLGGLRCFLKDWVKYMEIQGL